MNYKDIKFVNVHAHTQYSLLDGVGSVRDLYLETLRKGHAGVCVTDHGSYASFVDLYRLDKSYKKDKEIQDLLKEKERDKHTTLKGCEIYIYDDRYQIKIKNLLDELLENRFESTKMEIFRLLNQMKHNDKFKALFGELSDKYQEDLFKKKSKAKIQDLGPKLLQILKDGTIDDVIDHIEEFKTFADKSTASKTYKYGHLVVVAKNKKGHENLSYLSSMAHLPENFYKRPRVPLSELFKYKEGLVVATACFVGMIPQEIYRETGDAKELMELFHREFGDDFYIEVTISNIDNKWDNEIRDHVPLGENLQHKVTYPLIEIAKEMGLEEQIIITQDSHMPKKEDKFIQDIMILSDSSNSTGWHFKDAYYVMSIEEMHQKFKECFPKFSDEDFIKWSNKTYEILKKCENFELDRSLSMPSVRYHAHELINPIRIKEEVLERLLLKNSLTSAEDRYIVKKQAQEYLGGVKILNHFIDYSGLSKTDVDTEKSKEAKLINDAIQDELDEYLAKYSYLEDVKFVKDFLDREKYFTDARDSLRLCLLIILKHKKFDVHDETYIKRLFFEIKVIQFNGISPFCLYFLPFDEIIDFLYATEEIKGPGRGSAAGCLFSYGLDITDIDPARRNLPFWRFMLEERIGVVTNTFENLMLDKKYDYETSLKDYEALFNLVRKSLGESRDLDEELFYIRCKPHLASYFLNAKKDKYFNDENKNNSTVAYLLGLCPEPNGALNKTEPSPPDIDFDSSARDAIIRYLVKTKGKDRVALIGSYGTLKVKSAMKQVFRVEGNLTPSEQDAITKLVERTKFSEEDQAEGSLFCFRKAIDNSTELTSFFEKYPDTKNKIESILGSYNNMGIHACGVVILDEPVHKRIPLWYSKDKDMYITQLDKDMVEYMGAVKMDYLGVSNIETLRDTYKLIKKRHGIDYFQRGAFEKIIDNFEPEDTRCVIEGDTLGIFQMNTPTQTSGYKNLNSPPDLETASAMNALKRPGPMLMGTDSQFERRFNGEEEIHYFHPLIKKILEDTKGCLIYQEQVMEICQEIGGFTAFEADKIRKAMGKKKFDIIQKYKSKFIDYAVKFKGLSKKDATHLWNMCEKFAEYAFNRSHSFAYAFVSFMCIHARQKYPLEYICSLYETATRKNGDKEKKDIKDYNQRWSDIVKPPSVKNSSLKFEIDGDAIYMPLSSVKGIGDKTSKEIVLNRPYADFKDFSLKNKAYRMSTKSDVLKLILAGAFDDFYELSQSLTLNEKTYSKFKELAVMGFVDNEVIESYDEHVFGFKSKDAALNVNVSIKNKPELRKGLIKAYFSNYYHYAIKNSFKKKIDSLLEETPKELIYQILKNESIKGTILDNQELWKEKHLQEDLFSKNKDFSRFQDGYYNKVDNILKREPSKKEKEDSDKIINGYMKMGYRHFIMEEAMLLARAGDDFNKHFIDLKDRLRSGPLSKFIFGDPEIADELAESIKGKLIALKGRCHDFILNGEIDSLFQEICTYYPLHRKFFWKKVDDFYIDIIRFAKNNLTEDQYITLRASLCLKAFSDREFSFFSTLDRLPRKRQLTKETYSILKICGLKHQGGHRSINMENTLMFSSTNLTKIALVKKFLKEGRNFYSNIIKEDGGDNVGELLSRIVKDIPGIKVESLRHEVIEDLDSFIEGDIVEIFQENSENAMKTTELFTQKERAILSGNFCNMGTIFREERKYFLKEYGQGSNRKQLMNFFLRNKEFNCKYTLFDTGNDVSLRNGEGIKLSERCEDYAPAIIKTKLAFNFKRGLETQYYVSDGNVESIYFLMDYLEEGES